MSSPSSRKRVSSFDSTVRELSDFSQHPRPPKRGFACPSDRYAGLALDLADRRTGIALYFAASTASTATAASRTRSRTRSRTWHAGLALDLADSRTGFALYLAASTASTATAASRTRSRWQTRRPAGAQTTVLLRTTRLFVKRISKVPSARRSLSPSLSRGLARAGLAERKLTLDQDWRNSGQPLNRPH